MSFDMPRDEPIDREEYEAWEREQAAMESQIVLVRLDPSQFAEIERLLASAPPGPWNLGITEDTPGERCICLGAEGMLFARIPDIKHPHYSFADAARLIVAMRNAIGPLLAEVRAARAAEGSDRELH